MQMTEWGAGATHLLVDNDPKFTAAFDAVLAADGCEVKRVGPRTPNMNAYAERWVQTLRTECLDHFLVLGERHLAHLVTEFVAHYNQERPHQAKGNVPLPDADQPEPASSNFRPARYSAARASAGC